MSPPPVPEAAEVQIRVDAALARIERAQHELEAAAAELSAISGGALPLWRRTARLSDACHRLWEGLRYRDRRRWRMDGMHQPRDEEGSP